MSNDFTGFMVCFLVIPLAFDIALNETALTK
jgi:hypothetical protein